MYKDPLFYLEVIGALCDITGQDKLSILVDFITILVIFARAMKPSVITECDEIEYVMAD